MERLVVRNARIVLQTATCKKKIPHEALQKHEHNVENMCCCCSGSSARCSEALTWQHALLLTSHLLFSLCFRGDGVERLPSETCFAPALFSRNSRSLVQALLGS